MGGPQKRNRQRWQQHRALDRLSGTNQKQSCGARNVGIVFNRLGDDGRPMFVPVSFYLARRKATAAK